MAIEFILDPVKNSPVDGIAIISRHGQKVQTQESLFETRKLESAKKAGIIREEDLKKLDELTGPRIPGSRFDKEHMTITPSSQAYMTEFAENFVGDLVLDKVYTITSDHLRTQVTAESLLKGIKIRDRKRGIVTGDQYFQADALQSIGLGDGYRFDQEGLPDYRLQSDEYIATMFSEFFFPNKNSTNAPVMADVMSKYFSSLAKGLDALVYQKDGSRRNIEGAAGLIHVSHAPLVDSLIVDAYDLVDIVGKEARFNRDDHPGHVAQQEAFTGTIHRMGGTNPILVVNLKGKQFEYSLNQLNQRAQHYRELLQ